MPLEVWGTFSVADHLRERAFVTDILLYDRLVIPVPTDDRRSRWEEQGWDPDGLSEIIERVDRVNPDLVWQIPWDEGRERAFAKRFAAAQALAGDAHRLAEAREQWKKIDPDRLEFGITREILYTYANNPANGPNLPPDV